MKRTEKKKTAGSRQIVMCVVILALLVGFLLGCDQAVVGGGGDATADDADEGSDPPAEDTGSDTLDTSAMVLHLGFDGDLTDETGTSSTMTLFADDGGTATAAYSEDRNEEANGSIEFNGDYSMKVEDIDLSSADSITVTAWIRDDGSQSEKNRWIAAYISDGSTIEFAMRIRELKELAWQDGSFEAFVENSGGNGTRTTELVVPGDWVHVAMVYDGDDGELRLYQDGVRKNAKSLSLDIDFGNLIIGGGSGTNDDFHGRIDDVAVFTRALTDAEIATAKDQIGTN